MSDQDLFEEEEGSDAYAGTTEEEDDDPSPANTISVSNFFASKQKAGQNRRWKRSSMYEIPFDGEDSEPEQPLPRLSLLPKRICYYSKKANYHALVLKGTPNRYSSGGSGARASGTANDASPTTSPSQQLSSQLPRDDNPELPSTQGANGIQSEETSSSLTVALSKITSLLNTVVKRVERVEAELKNVNQSSPSSSDSTPSGDKKNPYACSSSSEGTFACASVRRGSFGQ